MRVRGMNTTSTAAPAMTERERFIDGQRVIASVMETHDWLPIPSIAGGYLFGFYGKDARERLAEAARVFPCSWRKNPIEGQYGSYFHLEGQIGGINVTLSASREAVCRRVVTGTHEVTETVKDPEALAKVPEVTVTRVVEDVTWDCGPLLAPQVTQDEPAAVTA